VNLLTWEQINAIRDAIARAHQNDGMQTVSLADNSGAWAFRGEGIIEWGVISNDGTRIARGKVAS
jgi:hypothetical protein